MPLGIICTRPTEGVPMALNPFVLFLSPGRSGTRFLYQCFQKTYPEWDQREHFHHESLGVKDTLPRRYFRPYSPQRQRRLLEESPGLQRQLKTWRNQVQAGPVVEFGWTLSHLAPLLHKEFGSRFQVVHLYRHPVMFAGSRSSMGNYRGRYPHEDKALLSPHDDYVQNKQFRERWSSMTPFERCLFWWLEYFEMGEEFLTKNPEVPTVKVPSERIFENPRDKIESLASFAGLQKRSAEPDVGTNPTRKAHRERYPVGREWRRYQNHDEIMQAGRNLGYSMDEQDLAPRIKRYQLPEGWASRARRYLGYWKIKSWLRRIISSEG